MPSGSSRIQLGRDVISSSHLGGGGADAHQAIGSEFLGYLVDLCGLHPGDTVSTLVAAQVGQLCGQDVVIAVKPRAENKVMDGVVDAGQKSAGGREGSVE